MRRKLRPWLEDELRQPPRFLQGKRTQQALAAIFVKGARCALCAAPHAGWTAGLFRPHLCTGCMQSVTQLFGPLCRICGKPVESIDAGTCSDCRRMPHLFLIARAFARYEGSVERAIMALKYQGETKLAPLLGEWVAEAYLRHFGEDRSFDLLPVPMHPVKQKKRGYNQAELIARAAARLLGQRVVQPLVRLEEQNSQTVRSRAQRLSSLSGAFGLAPDAKVAGGQFVLIDDVLTTGGTADACADVLVAAGAASVYVLTVGR